MKTKQVKNEKLKSLLPEIEKRIRTMFGSRVIKIVLFGSYARGDYDNESDVDIFVLVNDNDLRRYRKDRIKLITEFLELYNLLIQADKPDSKNIWHLKNTDYAIKYPTPFDSLTAPVLNVWTNVNDPFESLYNIVLRQGKKK